LDLWKTPYNELDEENLIINNLENEEMKTDSTNKNQRKLKKGLKINNKIKSFFTNIKDFEKKSDSISNLFIVPGDVIYLEQGKVVPCDCLIIDGYCSVVESYLTGESNHILKEALPKSNTKFSYENTKSILFQGTVINKCESSNFENGNNRIKCLVINTGFNTYWGSFLQNILFPKKMNFNFFRELRFFIYGMIIIYIIVLSISIYNYIVYPKSKFYSLSNSTYVERVFDFLIRVIDLITIILPPYLSICINLAAFYFNEILKAKEITCLSQKRLSAAGKVNVIVLDKTGTLTTDGLEISGFQTSKENANLGFDNVHKTLNLYNSMHREFWMRFCTDFTNTLYDDYLINWRNIQIYFLECLATCLSIDKLRDNNILGNTLDKELFRLVEWELEKIDEKWHDIDVFFYYSKI